jgi:hypothetical protein
MMTRRRIATILVLAAVACGSGPLALAPVAAQAQCGQSSAESTYGGQGTQIVSQPCEPKEPASTLPFTGLDLGLLVAAGLVLIVGGTLLRLRLRQDHGGQ